MHTVVDSEAAVLSVLVLIIDVVRVLGTSKTFLLTVLVDSPEDVNTVVNGLLVAVSAEQGGGEGEKGHILSLQFENWRSESESGDFIEAKSGNGDH